MHERQLLPNREQISAIDDIAWLEGLLDEVRETITRIEVDLEFGGDLSSDWEARARSALVVHRTCERRLAERIKALTSAAPVIDAAEAQRLRAQASEANRDAAVAAQVEKTKRTAMSIIEGSSFGRAFMDATKLFVSAEDYAELIDRAQELQGLRATEGVTTFAGLAA